MIYIDKYAYTSNFAKDKPEFKLLFGVVAVFAAVFSKTLIAYGFIFILMSYIIIYKAKISAKYFFKLLILPASFLFFSVIGVVLELKLKPSFFIGFKENSLEIALFLVAKALSAVCCLYFIILTTPVRDIVYVLQLIKCPKIFIDLLVLIYRFIFIIMEIASTKIKSQKCRQGYRGAKNFLKSFSMLWGSVFIQSFLKTEWIYKAMLVRKYDGTFNFIPRDTVILPKHIFLILLFILVVVLLNGTIF